MSANLKIICSLLSAIFKFDGGGGGVLGNHMGMYQNVIDTCSCNNICMHTGLHMYS